MAEDLGEKTEDATPRRRQQARGKGQVPRSQDLSAALLLLLGVVGLQNFGERIVGFMGRTMRYCLVEPWLDLDHTRAVQEVSKLAMEFFVTLLPWLVMMMVAAFAVNVLQSGGLVLASEKNYFDINKLNPVTGLGRLFSLRSLVKTGIDIAKVSVVAMVAYLFISGEMPIIASLAAAEVPPLAQYVIDRLFTLMYYLIAVLLVIAIADYAYQRYQFEEDLKMTKQEVKEENRDIQGDPMVRARRRQIQMQMARQRMLREVPEAEVVITNPTHYAVALQYRLDEMEAPVVVGKGADLLAEKIRGLALEHGIPIIENPPLARQLYRGVDVGMPIPEDAYLAVAEILAYVYQLKGRGAPERPSSGGQPAPPAPRPFPEDHSDFA